MKRRNLRFYIVPLLIFIVLVLFVDFRLEGSAATFFERNILFDREEVIFGESVWTRGTFNWMRLRDIIIRTGFLVIIAFEATVYMVSKISRAKERKSIINEIESRISEAKEGNKPNESEDMRLIDAEIRSIISEKENVFLKAREETEKKNDLVTYLAHDIKTPLAVIIGYLTILDESEVPEDIRKDYISRVLDKSYRLEDLINQFFDIVTFSLHEMPLNKGRMDADFFVCQIIEEMRPILNEKDLDFQVDIEDGMKIYADGELIARAINNLLKNAVSYSRKGTVINIMGKSEEDFSVFIIENDGDTISKKELDLMFNKFYRRDRARGQSAGAGLGLAIARQIAEKHGGTLESESYNGHTVFTLKLPCNKS